jgi:hypothetical protein
LLALAPVRRVCQAIKTDLELPEAQYTVVNYPTRFDCLETLVALQGSGVTSPKLNDCAWRLWDYVERHLDPDLRIDRSLRGTVAGKVVAQKKRPHRHHQLDRGADQCARLQRLCGVQGRVGCLDALRRQRVCRPGHLVHYHQHAAGAHPS